MSVNISSKVSRATKWGFESSGTHTPSGLNIEQTVFETGSTGDYAKDFRLYAVIDLGNLQPGDIMKLRVYRKTNGSNYRKLDEIMYVGEQGYGEWELEGLWGNASMTIKVTIEQTAGTIRSYFYRHNVLL